MIKFNIPNRFTGDAQFTAEIDCDDIAPHSVRLGLAVKQAIKQGANLSRADLYEAYLYGASLSEADLRYANLYEAYLYEANLSGADLQRANLSGANLGGADLYGANLGGADLCLPGDVGNTYVRLIHTDVYQIAYTAEHIQIGCEKHSIDDWMGFDDTHIRLMDGKFAVEWWAKWKPIIKQMIEAAPCKPTREDKSDD